MKITANDLLPCQRGRFMGLPIEGELQDLTENPGLAKAVFEEVDKAFQLSKGVATISGYARNENNAFLYVQVWDQDKVIRTLAFQDVGYAGIVHLDLVRPENGENLYESDLLADFSFDLDECFSVSLHEMRNQIFFVQAGKVRIDVALGDWRGRGKMPCFGYYVGGNFPPD